MSTSLAARAYGRLFNLVLSRMDPERAHHLAFALIRAIPVVGLARFTRALTRSRLDHSVHALGLVFDGPFGVAAGFDKDGKGVLGLGALGFSHIEVGTVTALAQPGNPRPRLFRLIRDEAVVNRMGFNNEGSARVASRLKSISSRRNRPVLGVNIGKSRVTAVEDAIGDYVTSARLAAPVADYLAVNVSSPNTPGLRGLQEIDRLDPLLVAIKGVIGSVPLLVKIAPDLSNEGIVAITDLALRTGLQGVIATNTTIERAGLTSDAALIERAGAGGLSGAPLAARSLEVLQLIRQNVPDEFCVISVGGVTTAEDVQQRLDAGATLVQGYTAFIYRGPLWARDINRGLDRIRSRRG